ncbi:polysaccharide deacetylase [Purpureocillium lavendulum]|uniref:Polysaccharide deacetylase n=1 Tax=Purpureocillium lavendulum TaxID=1247861 RepID=A0AB34FZ31_9HYPO|nr:polysaccharide deacetylase [Purpureocillium lavendulum]
MDAAPVIAGLALGGGALLDAAAAHAHVLPDDEETHMLEKRARCGANFGSCPAGSCCSSGGYCGTTEEYCAAPDCQLPYGPGCDTFKKPIGDSTENIARPKIGSVPYGTIITKCTSPGKVALTYDDGPESFTDQLLNKLDSLGVKATFFVSGNNVGKGAIDACGSPWTAVVKRTYAAGHQVAHHTWTHRDLEASNSSIRMSEMIYNEMAFRNIFGWFPTYMRPPFLSCGSNCMTLMGQLGYHIVSTNLDTKDYENDSPSLIQVSKDRYSNGMSNTSTSNSYIVLAHDTHEQTVVSLTDYMVKTAKDRGYQLVTVGECLGDPKENWYRSAGAAGACTPANGTSGGGTSSSSSSAAAASTSSAAAGTSSSAAAGSSSSSPPSSPSSSAATTGPATTAPGTTGTNPSSSSTAAAPSSSASGGSAPVSTDQSCGGTKGYTCQGSAYGNCCSAYGFWCVKSPGSSPAYCGTGCQPKYGTCDPSSETISNTTVGLCGPSYNATCLYFGQKTCCSKTSRRRQSLVLLLGRLLLVGLLEPLEEGLGSLANLPRRGEVHVLLAGLGAPLGHHLLADEVVVVVELENLDNLLVHVGVVSGEAAEEALRAAKKGLLVAHAGALRDLCKDVLVEERLGEDENRAVLALNLQLLGLEIDVDGIYLVDATLLLGLLLDPVAKLVIDGVATALTILILVVVEAELLLELARELGLTGLYSLLAHIDGPLVVVDLDVRLGGRCLDLVELIVATVSIAILLGLVGTVLGALFATAAGAILLGAVAILLLGPLGSTTLGLVLALLGGLVLEDVATELEAKINLGALATGLAVEENAVVADDVDVGFGVLALLAENKLVDETVQMILELAGLVGTVDDPTVVLGLVVGHGTQLEAEVLVDVGRRASQGGGDAGQVDDDGLDAVTLALNLGLQTLHLVAIEVVADIATDVDERHFGGLTSWLALEWLAF